MDIAVQDTFLYATGYVQDSLRIFSIADPRNPRRLGACADSGFPMCVSAGYCYLADQGSLNILDVRNPQNPHRVSSIGGEILSVAVRDTLCFFGTASNGLRVYNVKNPASPIPIGSLSGIQPADLYLPPTCDTVLYTPVFHAINIANPASPRIIGQVSCPGWDYGVAAVPALNYALVADYFDGLVAVSISNPTSPVVDTSAFGADLALDIYIDQNRAHLAQEHAGMGIIDISNPSRPFLLGQLDTVGQQPGRCHAVAAKDSLACIGWSGVPFFRTVDVSNPARPSFLGGYDVPSYPEGMVLRDSLCYLDENRRLQIINVARPRSPTLVGSCVLSGYAEDLDVVDSLAYVTHNPLTIINVARPSNPIIMGTWGGLNQGLDAVDTIVYVTASYSGLVALSVANPAMPRVLDSLYMTDTLWWNAVAVADSVAYVGGERVWSVDVSNPSNLRLIPDGTWTPPRNVARMVAAGPYIYAACQEGGICILETVQVGLSEADGREPLDSRPMVLLPNPAHRSVTVQAGPDPVELVLWDVAGRQTMRMEPGGAVFTIDLTGLESGLYFCELRYSSGRQTEKLIIQ
jgi:hypothetical protein